jgi:hypothetical protein
MAVFADGMRALGCVNDQQLQEMLRNKLSMIWAPATATVASSSSTSSSLAPRPPSPLRQFFLQCFSTLRKLTTLSKKSIDLNVARHYLAALLLDRFPQHMQPFLAYLDDLLARAARSASSQQGSLAAPLQRTMSVATAAAEGNGPRFSFDQWASVLEWCCSIHPHTLAGYEGPELGSWPVLIDDFVTWMCERAPAVRDASFSMRALMQAAANSSSNGSSSNGDAEHMLPPAATLAITQSTPSPAPMTQRRLQRGHLHPPPAASGLSAVLQDGVLPLDADVEPPVDRAAQRSTTSPEQHHQQSSFARVQTHCLPHSTAMQSSPEELSEQPQSQSLPQSQSHQSRSPQPQHLRQHPLIRPHAPAPPSPVHLSLHQLSYHTLQPQSPAPMQDAEMSSGERAQ